MDSSNPFGDLSNFAGTSVLTTQTSSSQENYNQNVFAPSEHEQKMQQQRHMSLQNGTGGYGQPKAQQQNSPSSGIYSSIGPNMGQSNDQFSSSQESYDSSFSVRQNEPRYGGTLQGHGSMYQMGMPMQPQQQKQQPHMGIEQSQVGMGQYGQQQGYRGSVVQDPHYADNAGRRDSAVVGLDYGKGGPLIMPNVSFNQQPQPYAQFSGQIDQNQNSMDELMKSLATMKTARESVTNDIPTSFDPLDEICETNSQLPSHNMHTTSTLSMQHLQYGQQYDASQRNQQDPFQHHINDPFATSVGSGSVPFNSSNVVEDFPDPFASVPFATKEEQATIAKSEAAIKTTEAGIHKEENFTKSEVATVEDPISKNMDDVSDITKNDLNRLCRECTFYTGYRGFTLDGLHTKRSVKGKYSVKIGWRTAIKICGDKSGIIILSHDRASILHHFKWKDIQMVDHVHKDTIHTSYEKRSRKNFLGVKLKDGSVYVINSQFTPELKQSFMHKANVPVTATDPSN
eukprot:CFRG5677T1